MSEELPELRSMLEGEDPLATDPKTARYWLAVYGQMADGLRQLPRAYAPTPDTPRRRRVDLALRWCEQRVEFWRSRLEELDRVRD